MSEEQDKATFYQQHKDDPDIWGEPEEGTPSTRRRGRLNATITVRFPPEEASGIRELAKNLGVSYSDVVRRAVREFIHPRISTGYEWPEHEDRDSVAFSNADTHTGSLALIYDK